MTKSYTYRLSPAEAEVLIQRWQDANDRYKTFFKWVNEQMPWPAHIKGTIYGTARLYVYGLPEDVDLVQWKLTHL